LSIFDNLSGTSLPELFSMFCCGVSEVWSRTYTCVLKDKNISLLKSFATSHGDPPAQWLIGALFVGG